MYCTSCGSFSPDGTRVCSNCGKELLPPTGSSKTQSSAGFGVAAGRLFKLPAWVLFLLLLIGAGVLVRFLAHSSESRPQNQQTNDAKAGEQRTTSGPATQGEPQVMPADAFALALRETLQSKYRDIDVGVADHVLSLISDAFRDGTRRESQTKELLKKRASLCAIEIWTVAVGYSKDVLSQEEMVATSLECPGEKTAHEQTLTPRREQLAAELSDTNLHVSADGDTLIFDSELFSDFGGRANFLQAIGSNPYYKKLFCELEFAHMELRYRTKTMRTVPIVCK